MITCGVDLGGKKIAVSFFDKGKMVNVLSYESPLTTRAGQLWDVADWSYQILRLADLVVVEEPLIGRGVRSSLQLAQTAGAVLSKLGDRALHTNPQFVEVSTWKKQVVGNGNASKEQVRQWLESQHPAYATQCGANQDKVDATCIGLYAVQLRDRSINLAEL